MNNSFKSILLATTTIGLLLATTGCVNHQKKPIAQMATTEAAIKDAVEAGAREAAAVELRTADQHFAAAKNAADNEEYLKAKRLAEKAEADAKLAKAIAKTAEAKVSAHKLQQSISVLRKELEKQLAH